MKIFDRGTAAAGSSDVGKAQDAARLGRSETQRSGTAAAAGGADRVELSKAAGQVRQALDASVASRARQVETLQAAYRSGTYVPDSAGTSRGMIREAFSGGAA